MHPALILLPVAALLFAPRLWVNQVLKRHHRIDDTLPDTGHGVARKLLDSHQLQAVRVEVTDIGDHYDPQAHAVRLGRDNYHRTSLTAVTTAAHEVAHAIQHATGYPPFEWRARLVKVARVTGQAGTVLLLAVPAASLVTRRALPPMLIGNAALAMLGTGMAAQLSALPTEIDASFRRALPMLEAGIIDGESIKGARQILLACSLTYLTSSLIGVINIWPWLGGGRVFLVAENDPPTARCEPVGQHRAETTAKGCRKAVRSPIRGGGVESAFRKVAKPLIRQWLQKNRINAR